MGRCLCLVVHRQLGQEEVGVAELLLVPAEVDGLLGCLGARQQLGLACTGRQREGGLLLAAPGDSRAVEHEDEARGGVLHGPQSESVTPWSVRSSPS